MGYLRHSVSVWTLVTLNKSLKVSYTKILASRLRIEINHDPEPEQSSQPRNLLACIVETIEIALVLGNTPCYFLVINVGVVPINQLLSILDIFSYWLLGQNMLSCAESSADILRLVDDRKSGMK